MERFNVAVIGGGIVGAATAMALAARGATSIIVLEAEAELAAHQTGHNSGVIHAGLYYKPGSLKATLCASGREELYRFCSEKGIAHERCGKLVVATDTREVSQLEDLESRGRANGIAGLRRLTPEEAGEREPHVRCVDALLVPETGIVDYTQVTQAYARCVRDAGGVIRTGARVTRIRRSAGGLVLETTAGEVECGGLVNCAGLQCDRVARMAGVRSDIRIVPFRGEYYELLPDRRSLVRHLIYPVPNPNFPFLGVHFTRMVDGTVEAGPNAVLAFKREGYTKTSFSLRDTWDTFTYPGFWRLSARYWRMGAEEIRRSGSRRAFVRAMQRMVPDVRPEDVSPGGAGVRAQALDSSGKMVDDFCIVEADRMVHVLNAPSPAATASIAIGRYIADLARKNFGLGRS